MLEPVFAALAAGAAGQALAAMATTNTDLAQAQFASTYENPATLDADACSIYFAPLAAPQRGELLRGFGDALKNRDQMIALAPRLRALKAPAQVIWGDADTAFNTAESLKWLRENLGGVRRIVRVPRAKLFFPEEHPRLLATMVRKFWDNN